jgi:hypothetical protein
MLYIMSPTFTFTFTFTFNWQWLSLSTDNDDSNDNLDLAGNKYPRCSAISVPENSQSELLVHFRHRFGATEMAEWCSIGKLSLVSWHSGIDSDALWFYALSLRMHLQHYFRPKIAGSQNRNRRGVTCQTHGNCQTWPRMRYFHPAGPTTNEYWHVRSVLQL